MAIQWNQYRKEIAAGKQDWIGAAQGEYGEYLYRARERFARGEAATVRGVKALYRRVAAQLRSEIESITPGTLRRAHLTALASALEKAAKTLNQETLDAVTRGIRLAVDEAVSGPEQVTQELLAGTFGRAEVKWLFADINQRAVMSLLARTRHDGLKLSDRVWRTSQHARRALQKIVEDGVTRGLDSRKLALQVQRYLQPDVWTVMKLETRRNLGVPKNVSYEAMRLARTEMNNAFHEGTVMAYRAMPSARGVYWRLSARHPLPDVCDDYASHNDNGFWPKGEEPARPHPQCFCVILPAMEDPEEFTERLRAWMRNPASQPDLEMWYNNTARRFLKRPSAVLSGWSGTGGSGGPGGTTPGEPGDSPFVQALARHGISRDVAQAIESIGEDIRQRTVAAGVEHAAMIDAAEGTSIGEVLSGEVGGVDISKHTQALQPGRKYVQLHTHPGSSSFSGADLAILVRNDGVEAMAVFGADNTRYVVSKAPGATPITPETAVDTWRAEYNARYLPYAQAVISGQMTEAEARKAHTHEVMEAVAKLLGLRYERFSP